MIGEVPERSSVATIRRRPAKVAIWLSYERWPRLLNAAPCLSLPYTSVSLESRSSVTGPDAVRPKFPVHILGDLGQLGHRRLALAGVQSPHQLPRRGRRHDLCHRSQLRSGLVLTQLVHVHQVIAAHRHHLGQRAYRCGGWTWWR